MLLNIAIYMWENIGVVKFWQIADDDANDGESDDRSSAGSFTVFTSIAWWENFWQIVHHSPNSLKLPYSIFFHACQCQLVSRGQTAYFSFDMGAEKNMGLAYYTVTCFVQRIARFWRLLIGH